MKTIIEETKRPYTPQVVDSVATIIFFKDGNVIINRETVESLKEHKDFILALLDD